MASKLVSGSPGVTGRCASRRSLPHRVTSYFPVVRVDKVVTNYIVKGMIIIGGRISSSIIHGMDIYISRKMIQSFGVGVTLILL